MTVAAVLLSVATFNVHAMTLQDMIDSAKANSQSVVNIEIARRNSEISLAMTDLDSITVLSADGRLTQNDFGDYASTGASMTFLATIPLDDDTSAKAGVDAAGTVFWSENSTPMAKSTVSLTPNAGYTKTIKVDSYADTRDDISRLRNSLQIELNYNQSMISFENQLLNDLASITQTKYSISTSEKKLEKLEKDLKTDILLGSVVPGSIVELSRSMSIESARISLNSLQSNLETAIASFERTYGVPYEDIREVGETDLTFTPDSEGNTQVMLSALALEKAKQDLEARTGVSNTYVLSANADAPVSYAFRDTSGKVQAGLNASVSAKATMDNLTLGATFSTSFSDIGLSTFDWTPSLTVTGSWSNAPSVKKQADELEIQQLQNAVLTAQYNYDNALNDYNSSIKSINNDILSHYSDVQQLLVQMDYHSRILEYTQKLHDNGLATESELDDARDDCENDELQMLVLQLKARILANRIRMIEL